MVEVKEEGRISFNGLVEARREEMQHMRPGMITIVSDGEKSVEISSPSAFDRSSFRIKEVK